MTLKRREQELLRGISTIADEHCVRVCIDQTIKGAAICGLGAFVGGLVGGAQGMAIGGGVAGLYAMYNSDSYRTLPEVLKTMDEKQIKNMLLEIQSAVYKLDRRDLLAIVSSLVGATGEHLTTIITEILETIVSFFGRVFQQQVTYLKS